MSPLLSTTNTSILPTTTLEIPMKKHEVNSMFKFKSTQQFDESNFSMKNIEHKSSGFIAGRLIDTLEKKGYVTQALGYDLMPNGEERPHKEYHFETKLEMASIAMLSVQLSGIIPLIDVPMPMQTIVESTHVWKTFYRISRANASTIKHPGNMNKAYWVMKATKAMQLALDSHLLETTEDGNIIRSDRYLSTCISRQCIAHQITEITDDNRRKERVKMNFNPRKDGTSAEVRKAITFIEAQGQVVNLWMLDAINKLVAHYEDAERELPDMIKTSKHVIAGCNHLAAQNVLYSEYFMDLRGRMYQFCHSGPNPQSSDLARALCSHDIVNPVSKGSIQHDMFLAELEHEVIGDDTDLYMKEKMLRRAAIAPEAALIHYFETIKTVPFKKFFTYLNMAKDWVAFEDTGICDCKIGFGPDAKCSGAQILAILAGSHTLAKACGLTSSPVKTDDVYIMSTKCIDRLLNESTNPAFKNLLRLTRNEIKTPFMAIQYGGGVPALRFKKFEPIMERIGVPFEMRDEFCKDYVIAGIQEALGAKVGSLLEGLRNAAQEVLTITGKEYFNYRHIDGFTCTKKGDANVRLTDTPLQINLGDMNKKAVIFGSLASSTKEAQGWLIKSNTIGVLQAQNFVHYFPVHFIQGLDAVMARKIANKVQDEGLRGYSSIHDQFRVCLEDVPEMMNTVVPAVYEDMFLQHNPLKQLQAEMSRVAKCDIEIEVGNPLKEIEQVVTSEVVRSVNAYYFE